MYLIEKPEGNEMRKSWLVAATVATFVAVPAAPAVAAVRGASECLNTFENDLDAYYRDGWDREEIASSAARDGTTLTLRCGNELSGVIHIAYDDGSGSGHKISRDGSADAAVATCFRRTVTEGAPSIEGDRVLLTRHFGQSGKRSYVRYGSAGTVYTMYTSGAGGNDWTGCAR